MIQVIFVSVIIIYSFFVKDKRKILLLLVAILPFNDILKIFCEHNGGDGLFSFWKEFAITILLFRTLFQKTRNDISIINNKIIHTYIFIVFYFLLFFIIGTEKYGAFIAFRTFRNVAFLPILIFISSRITLDKAFLEKIFITIICSSTLMGLLGILECHFGYREVIRQYMGQILDTGNDGTIYYNTSNLKILGFERMASVMGTPNQFGNYMALSSSFIYFCLKQKIVSKKYNIIFWIAFVFVVLCLIESFCRTAFVMFLLILFISEYRCGKKVVIKNIIMILFVSVSLLFIASFINDTVSEIVSATLSGNEASSADRSNNFIKGMDFLLSNPFGYGLGSTENSVKNFIFFSESAFLNIGVEAGIISIILFWYFCLLINNVLKKNNSFLSMYSSAIILTNLICFLFANIFGTPYIYIYWIFTSMGLMKTPYK